MAAIQPILSLQDLEQAVVASRRWPVWLFKHSLACGISSVALKRFQTFVAEQPEDAQGMYGLIEIQTARDVARALTAITGVRHESPQALLLRQGAAVWHANHGEITGEALQRTAEHQARRTAGT